MQSPLDISETEQYWVRSRDVSDAPAVAGDGYYAEHDVRRPAETTAEALPPTDSETIREIDREALDEEKLIGKWQVTVAPERLDELWPRLVADAEAGVIWAVKAMTAFGYDNLPMYDEHILTVYTPNYFETDDVWRAREHLRTEHDVTHDLYYKPDIYTAKGIVADTVEEFGLAVPARYVG